MNSFPKSLIITIIIWAIMPQTVARAQKKYTLQRCIDIALQQNLQLKVDGLDLEKANAGIQQAYSNLLPTISANASYQYSAQVQTSILPAEIFGGTAGNYIATSLGIAQTRAATVQLTQNLYNPSAFIALKAAKVLVYGNQLQIKSSKEDLVFNVSAAYYNIQSQVKQEELTAQSLRNTDSLLQTTMDQLKAGLATQTDIDRLTVTRDNTKASLQSLKNSEEKYYNLLKVLINIELTQNIVVETFAEDQYMGAAGPASYDPMQKTNYLKLLQDKKVSELQYKNIKAGYLPTISLFGNYGFDGYYNNANPLKTINDRYYPVSAVGIKISLTIFDGFSIKYQAKQKQIEIKKYEVQFEKKLKDNDREVADAETDLRNNLITYESQQRNLALAQKVMADINTQYKSGLVKVSDVINTNSDLQTAQNNYVRALINIKQAELNLKRAQGSLLKF